MKIYFFKMDLFGDIDFFVSEDYNMFIKVN